jgi:hypothetical protein
MTSGPAEFFVKLCNFRAKFDSELVAMLDIDFAAFFTTHTAKVKGVDVVSEPLRCGSARLDEQRWCFAARSPYHRRVNSACLPCRSLRCAVWRAVCVAL